MAEKNKPILTVVKEYFGMSAKEMMAEWPELTSEDKQQLMVGIASGTLDY